MSILMQMIFAALSSVFLLKKQRLHTSAPVNCIDSIFQMLLNIFLPGTAQSRSTQNQYAALTAKVVLASAA